MFNSQTILNLFLMGYITLAMGLEGGGGACSAAYIAKARAQKRSSCVPWGMVEQDLAGLGELVLFRILLRARFTCFRNAMWLYYVYGNITL